MTCPSTGGLLTRGSSRSPAFPPSCGSGEIPRERSSLTVAGPCGLCTQLPFLSGYASVETFDGMLLRPFYNGLMSKSSVVTVRETPVAKTTSATVGGLVVVAETIEVDTTDRLELVDLTDTAMAFVRRSGVRKGCCRCGRCTPPSPCSSTNRNRARSRHEGVSRRGRGTDEVLPHNDPTTPTAIARMRTRTCARCCSVTRRPCRSAAGNW